MRAWAERMWTGPRWEAFLLGVLRRAASAGAEPQPWWLPRRVLTVVSVYVDVAAGVGAVWAEWRPGSPRMTQHLALCERYGDRWRYVGGGFGSGDDPVDVDVLDVRDGAGVLSRTRGPVTTAPWISCAKIRLGRDVTHVVIGTRRIEAPGHRALITTWTSPSRHTSPAARPLIVALGHDGTELSRIGPLDSLDSHTWARLRDEEP
ncbi:hypothetical protein [Streptomyces lanatus]|uniref:Uncharacterized protein n=1 Tax=Streptomyces lanatus TaxID=66900 RepID=A0ABV1XHN4_9ACTN|nr:hypothetical protein [Streptomyces lanatus]GHG94204.1 hypothetical protein GCM10018780_17290 [Streptomyces lanatus]